MSKQAPGGPMIDVDAPTVPSQPVHERYSDRDFKTKLAPTHVAPAELNPYRSAGLPGEKIK